MKPTKSTKSTAKSLRTGAVVAYNGDAISIGIVVGRRRGVGVPVYWITWRGTPHHDVIWVDPRNLERFKPKVYCVTRIWNISS